LLFDFRTVVSFVGTAVFLLAPSRLGPDRTKGEKNEKQEQGVLKRNLQLFWIEKGEKKWLREG